MIDRVIVTVRGGAGGDGCSSFRREKFVPRGGPDGGDGGHGGSVILRVDPQKRTLIDFRYRREYRAERGQHGKGKAMTGRAAEDLVVLVPPGTLVRDPESDNTLADLVLPGDEFVAARGGRGGQGNARRATPTDRAPRRADPGEPGEERVLALELKLLADVGLVGKPNAGKSTLLSRVSRARPRIGDYPFTTLEPMLGLVETRDGRGFVMADIPGLIEGSHEGRGMGHEFLRHIERCRVLIFLLDATGGQPAADYRVLQRELRLHRPDLLERPRLVVLNKMDAASAPRATLRKGLPRQVRFISGVTGDGVGEMVDAAAELLAAS